MFMIKSVIFDLNGVFIQSPKLSDRFKNDFGVDGEKFLPVLKEIMDQIRRPGAGDMYNYWQPYFTKWGVKLTKEEFFNYWFKAEKENKEMTDLARSLKKQGLSIFILSNNFQERARYYKDNFPFLAEIFNKVYYSWQAGFVKPSRDYFELIIRENELNPHECLYFDDSEKNIEVAKSFGMKAYIFENREQVERIIKKNIR